MSNFGHSVSPTTSFFFFGHIWAFWQNFLPPGNSEFRTWWQMWIRIHIQRTRLRNPCFLCACIFLCAQWNLETETKYYISRILLNCYFTTKMLITKDMVNCPAKAGNKMLKCSCFGFYVQFRGSLEKRTFGFSNRLVTSFETVGFFCNGTILTSTVKCYISLIYHYQESLCYLIVTGN